MGPKGPMHYQAAQDWSSLDLCLLRKSNNLLSVIFIIIFSVVKL